MKGLTAEEWAKDFKGYINELELLHDDYNGIMAYIDDVLPLLKEQEKRINELEEKLRIDIPSKERNDNFDLYDTPIFGFHD